MRVNRLRAPPDESTRRPVRVEFRNNGAESAIVFVHGFGGQVERTWGRFPNFMADVRELDGWDIFGIGYSTSLRLDIAPFWAADAGLTVLGYYLRTMLALPPLDRYKKVALVAHSMGGLIAQQALLDAETRARVSHLFLFGTPSLGVSKANVFVRLKQQARDMAVGSAFIAQLRDEWAGACSADPPFALHVVAGERDTFVSIESAFSPFADNVRFVIPGDHSTIVRPNDVRDLAVQMVVRALVSKGQRDNLPPELTRFIGRNVEIAELKQLVHEHRLVTILGAGGVGKTRLSLRVAGELSALFEDGVWFAALAPIANSSLVAGVLAQTLNVKQSPSQPVVDSIVGNLKRKRLLLVVDNCEHVIDEVRKLTETVLRDCPGVQILATSRESFRIAGEQVYHIPTLAVPPPSTRMSADEAYRYSAVELFTERARCLVKDFELTDANAAAVAEICRRLDGIPLAIELAAARVRILSPPQLARKLDERFRVLTGGDLTALPRQQTMRALIDWSYDLLSPEEQMLFGKLSIFAGSFTLEAASAVCCDDATDEIAVMDGVTSLTDKSLVLAEPAVDQMRYRLLESTRDYAREKLRERGEHEATARAHARAYLAFAEQAEAMYLTSPDRTFFACVAPDIENWRAALDWALASPGDVLVGQRIVGALRWVWWTLDQPSAEALRWVHAAQNAVDCTTPDSVSAKLGLAEAWIEAVWLRDDKCLAAAERALALYQKVNDTMGTLEADWMAGRALLLLGRFEEGELRLNRVLETSKALDVAKLTATILISLGSFGNDYHRMASYFDEALRISKAIGAERLAGVAAINRAEAEFRDGNALGALQLAEEGRYAPSLGRDVMEAEYLANTAAYLVALGRYEEARERARAALPLKFEMQSEYGSLSTIQHLAAVAALDQNYNTECTLERQRRAARLLGYIDARYTALDTHRQPTEQQEYDKMLPALRAAFTDDEVTHLMHEGGVWGEEEAIGQALQV